MVREIKVLKVDLKTEECLLQSPPKLLSWDECGSLYFIHHCPQWSDGSWIDTHRDNVSQLILEGKLLGKDTKQLWWLALSYLSTVMECELSRYQFDLWTKCGNRRVQRLRGSFMNFKKQIHFSKHLTDIFVQPTLVKSVKEKKNHASCSDHHFDHDKKNQK